MSNSNHGSYPKAIFPHLNKFIREDYPDTVEAIENWRKQIKEVLIMMQHECFSGVHVACHCCSDREGRDGAMRKIIQVLPYWDELMELVQSSPTTARKEE